ncbi:MAG: hypothetical protein H7325_02875 [Pedobacter sp.]|nr:hypothetical protein [Pedobacter sp.]
MKKLKTTALVLGLFTLLAGTTIVRAQDYDDGNQSNYSNDSNVSLQTFYDELSPYGTWIQDPQYGYVWRPDVDQRDFRPYYTQGRWAMTEYGNTWVSDYDWGWAPFHYGRWVYNNYRQWIWLPDTNWGPAWVDWRSGGGYYGWAPMGPGININLSFGRRYALPTYCWNFIPQRSIYSNYYPSYDYGRNNVYIRNTTIINNTYVYDRRSYYGGPSRSDIRRVTNRDVTVYRVNRSDRPGASVVNDNEVNIYRPRPERGSSNSTAAPKDYQRGSIASVRDVASGRPERGAASVNNNADRTNATQENRRATDQNGNRDAVGSGRPQRGVANSNGNQAGDRNVMDRNPRDQNGITAPVNQTNARPTRNEDASNQRANVDAARQQQDQQRTQRAQQAVQMQQQRAQRGQEQAAQTQREQQAQQQRAQRVQQDQATQAQATQAQRQQQAEQQRAQHAQQEQRQRQEQTRQQPQRVERTQQPKPQQAPTRREESGGGGRPTRGE